MIATSSYWDWYNPFYHESISIFTPGYERDWLLIWIEYWDWLFTIFTSRTPHKMKICKTLLCLICQEAEYG